MSVAALLKLTRRPQNEPHLRISLAVPLSICRGWNGVTAGERCRPAIAPTAKQGTGNKHRLHGNCATPIFLPAASVDPGVRRLRQSGFGGLHLLVFGQMVGLDLFEIGQSFIVKVRLTGSPIAAP